MSADRPLSGVRVLANEVFMAGPYCTLMLADAGAEVIKVERPVIGDPRRGMPPYAEKDGVKKAAGFMAYNRNKKSIVLDLSGEEGRGIFKELAAKSDVVLENVRPGGMDRMGLGYEDLKVINPRLIYASISGFGRLEGYQGPFSDRPAFDIVAEAMSGLMHGIGFEDKPPSTTVHGMADIISGMTAAWGITQALYMRERTGEGQYVDTAMYDSLLAMNAGMVKLFSVAGQSVHRGRQLNIYPKGAYMAKDGYIALTVPNEAMWERLCQALNRPDLLDDERTKNVHARFENRDFVDAVINDSLAEFTRDEAVTMLNAAGLAAAPVQTAEDLFECPQLEARGALVEINDPDVGDYKFARTAPHLSAAPDIPTEPAPALGGHTREILLETLGYADAQINQLIGTGTVQE
ncbi:MAG: CoA transferase [Rhodospirillaceae bacterium]|jgi:CoA:oxalate CoA-transferase|nr:CoA transferase [Rhodospirillales bacterium]MBT3906371.1 CoA transferase [Rhodospirillaceae bacterium]MBT4703772.1 CoA transferase [Rhodospirillaceae bacterium]MBT5036369.1 CoA transferase [Rhodospirillaceae bacterium]MBT6222271.1 CoA transferase [Rhodospirillaceae bacterium]